MNMYEGDELTVTDATCPGRLKVKKITRFDHDRNGLSSLH